MIKIFLTFYIFFAIFEGAFTEHKNNFYCYDSMLPFERSKGGHIDESCPEGLEFYNSVQLCCTNKQDYKPMIDEDNVLYQQHYVVIPEPNSPNAIPNGCIRAVHLPNESVPFCGPFYKKNKNSIRNRKLRIYTKFVSVPVSNGTQNNFCCLPTVTILPNKQTIYHGTVAGQLNRHGDQQEIMTIRNTCNEGPIMLDMIGDENKSIHGIYDYNRLLCYIPKNDADLTTPGDYRAEIKIRNHFDRDTVDHTFVIVGNYEYDFVRYGARRRVFRHHKDDVAENCKKSKSFVNPLFVSSKKADEVFWEMATKMFLSYSEDKFFGWPNGFSRVDHNCVDFVYQFVCLLLDGKCPEKKLWPDNFVLADKVLNKGRYMTNVPSDVSVYGSDDCALSTYTIQIKLDLTKGYNVPPVVTYLTGITDPYTSHADANFIKTIEVQQKAYAKSRKDDGTVVYKAEIKVCQRDVRHFKILDSKNKILKDDFRIDGDEFLDLNSFHGFPIEL